MGSKPVNDVLIISNEALFASALTELLAVGGAYKVRAARSLKDARVAANSDRIIIYDVNTDAASAVGAIAEFIQQDGSSSVIAVVSQAQGDIVPAMLDAGVCGFVGRDATPEELMRAVAEVAAGYVFASRLMLRDILSRFSRPVDWANRTQAYGISLLAPRESEVVNLLVQGMTNREIAQELHLSEATVKAHLGRVMSKWKVRDRLQVALHALGRVGEDQ